MGQLFKTGDHHRLAVFVRMQPGTLHRLAVVVEDVLAAIV